jgi:hypothetical protein
MMQMQQLTQQMQQASGGMPQQGQPGLPPQGGGQQQQQITMEEEVPAPTGNPEAEFLEVPVEEQGIQTREEAVATSS